MSRRANIRAGLPATSPDLHTPLAVARGRLKFAVTGPNEQHFDEIKATLVWMDELSSDLLLYAKLDQIPPAPN